MKFLPAIIILFMASLLFNCGSQKGSESNAENGEEVSDLTSEGTGDIPAVCIWDKLSVRETPSAKGKYLTSISIGEGVTYLGESAVDSTDERTYLKIRLLDGTEGWSLEDFVIPNSTAAVFTDESEVYKRPDLLTKANKTYSKMDIVAIKEKKDDWLEVVGKRTNGKYIESGWVKSDNASENSVDIATAKFAKAALEIEDPDGKNDALMEIIDNLDLSNSTFISFLRDEVNDLQETDEELIEDDVMEVEMADKDTTLSTSDSK